MGQSAFKRVEKKYLLNKHQYQAVLNRISNYMDMDRFGKHKICNIYYDTKTDELIRNSIEKPVYKEKLRVRSYGIPKEDSKVYVELKKKYKGIVYKRRQEMSYSEARLLLEEGKMFSEKSQIVKEIDWFMRFYEPYPKTFIAYDRIAFCGKDNPDLRLTIDSNIICRNIILDLRKGVWGKALLRKEEYLMEIKITGAMPLWLAGILSENNIYQTSFSKYGKWYMENINQIDYKGGVICV